MDGYNVVIIGKSGVGKSSLLNYLFGKDIAKTGSGKPQTGKGFYYYESKINGKQINIYDSWGLEAGKSAEWLQKFNDFQSDKKNEDDVSKWIHSVIYCVSGEGARIEDFELEIINSIKSEALSPVVVMTKADAKDADVFAEKLDKIIGVSPVKVCNINTEIKWGNAVNKKEQFGRDGIIEAIKESAVSSFNQRVKYLFDNKLKIAKKQLDEVILTSFIKLLNEKAEEGKVSKKDLANIEKDLKHIVVSSRAEYKKDITSYIERAKEFYENDIFPVFGKSLDKVINLDFEIPPETEVSIIDILTVIFFPIALIKNFFGKQIPKDELKVYPVKKIIEEFKKSNF